MRIFAERASRRLARDKADLIEAVAIGAQGTEDNIKKCVSSLRKLAEGKTEEKKSDGLIITEW